MIKGDKLADALQVCLDSVARKVLILAISFMDFVTVPPELMSVFSADFVSECGECNV